MKRVLVNGMKRSTFWDVYLPEEVRKTPGLVIRKQEGFFTLNDTRTQHVIAPQQMRGQQVNEVHLWTDSGKVTQSVIEIAKSRLTLFDGKCLLCAPGFDPHG